MIDHAHDLPVSRQCRILKLAHSTAYYTPQPTSGSDLLLMRRIDELHLEYPFAGSRMPRGMRLGIFLNQPFSFECSLYRRTYGDAPEIGGECRPR